MLVFLSFESRIEGANRNVHLRPKSIRIDVKNVRCEIWHRVSHAVFGPQRSSDSSIATVCPMGRMRPKHITHQDE